MILQKKTKSIVRKKLAESDFAESYENKSTDDALSEPIGPETVPETGQLKDD